MATSGSKDFALTRSSIIEAALRKIGEYDAGASITGDDTSDAARTLNAFVKSLVVRGADLFLREEVTLFLQKDQQSYSLGSSSADHHTASYVETTLSAAEASGQTVISVTSSAGMTAADKVGIKMDDDTIHWSTISSVDSGVQITIANATDDDAASGNKVYAYTTKADRPQRIIFPSRRDTSDNDTKVRVIGEDEYRGLSNKGSSGPVNSIWYHPTLTNGTLYAWPVDGGSSVDKLLYTALVLPDDFDAAGNNPEFPIEWGQALIWGLAAELSFEYGLPRLDRTQIYQKAELELEHALSYDVEWASLELGLEGR